jgi:hypothetical protein
MNEEAMAPWRGAVVPETYKQRRKERKMFYFKVF